jgi:protein-tyrosine phosphatase
MGAVHGVYLKYVGLSAVSYAGYSYLVSSGDVANLITAAGGFRNLLASSTTSGNGMGFELSPTSLKVGAAAVLQYSTILNGLIAVLFKLEIGMGMIGKNRKTGQIPMWSYLLYFPFHLPSILYTRVHGNNDKKKKVVVPVASEVQPGWWVGGCYSNELNKDWGGVIDATVEFPEGCFYRSKSYFLCETWDGVPASPARLEEAAQFAVEARKEGDVLVHCAHGRGRSTTLMCACLVRAGLFSTWEEAFEKGIKPGRSVCKLNRRMRNTLTEWQTIYVDNKKAE